MVKNQNENFNEEALLSSRLIEYTQDGLYSYRVSDGVILFANKGFLDILEIEGDPRSLVGKKLMDLIIYVEDEGTIRKALMEKGHIRDFEYKFKTLKGTEKWVLHNSFIRKDSRIGEGVVEAIVRDITTRKLVEFEIYNLNEDLLQKKLELEATNKMLKSKINELEKFFRITKDRELKILELKQKIKDLEKELDLKKL